MTVEIDGANNIVKTNTISEVTSANGVTVDGLSIKDSKLVTANSVITTNITDANVTTAKITDANVTQGKIADQAINEAKMQISNAPVNGYALTAQSGNTGGMTWAEMSGGRSTLLATTTLNNTSNVTYNNSLITSTYDNYMVTVENLQTGSGNVFVKMRLSNNNGSSYEGDSANDYRRVSFNGIENESNNGFTSRYSTGTAHIGLTGNYSNNGNDAAFKIDGYIQLFTLNSSSYKKTLGFFMFGQQNDPPLLVYEQAVHVCDGTQSAINNIKIFPSSGNLASGKIKLWGLG